MSFPTLYKPNETNFDHNGIGILGDCISCEVLEERNGRFELTMEYPFDGIHFENIVDRAIIKAKPDPYREYQLFRVYSKSKPLLGIVTVNAFHISYDLNGIPVAPFVAEGVQAAMQGLKDNAVIECPFTFWTDKGTVGTFNVKTPASIRSKLGGDDVSILSVFSGQGGEFEFDNFDVKFHGQRGKNRGLSIRYGKNLTDFRQEENCANVYTGVYPYWVNDDESIIQLDEKIVNADGEYDFQRIMVLDVTDLMEAANGASPSQEEIRVFAKKYISENNIGIPEVSLTISYINLEKSSEYNPKMIEEASLCDYANVEFPAMKVSTTAQIVQTVYNVILERYKNITLGSVRKDIADTIVAQNKKINQIIGG